MKFPRRQFLHLLGAAAALPVVSRVAMAQAYPTRPVRVIIGYPPGGSADITARLMSQWLTERLGQSFVVESRPGAGTNLATEAAVRAAPDGYTLFLVAPANAINATLYDKLNFNFVRDIAPVAGIIRFPNDEILSADHPSLEHQQSRQREQDRDRHYLRELASLYRRLRAGSGATPCPSLMGAQRCQAHLCVPPPQ